MRKCCIPLLLAAGCLPAQNWRLDSIAGLETHNATAEAATYGGRHALRLLDQTTPAPPAAPGHALAILSGSDFEDGSIEVDVAGKPRSGAFEGARGFIGIAFRLQDAGRFELFYIRPTNGRADDQLRRNHSTQYTSEPEFPWQQESPGVYESYTDLAPGEWTKLRIVVSGVRAQLFVNGASQPCLRLSTT